MLTLEKKLTSNSSSQQIFLCQHLLNIMNTLNLNTEAVQTFWGTLEMNRWLSLCSVIQGFTCIRCQAIRYDCQNNQSPRLLESASISCRCRYLEWVCRCRMNHRINNLFLFSFFIKEYEHLRSTALQLLGSNSSGLWSLLHYRDDKQAHTVHMLMSLMRRREKKKKQKKF